MKYYILNILTGLPIKELYLVNKNKTSNIYGNTTTTSRLFLYGNGAVSSHPPKEAEVLFFDSRSKAKRWLKEHSFRISKTHYEIIPYGDSDD